MTVTYGSEQLINLYGDRIVPTTGSHGPDIASQRMDDLDAACIEWAIAYGPSKLKAVDIGCGRGIQALRLASLGASVLAVDLSDLSPFASGANTLLGRDAITYFSGDVRELPPSAVPTPLQLIYSQRFIHYLRHEEACELLLRLQAVLSEDGRLFLSASGIDSELGDGYAHRDRGVENRFSVLSPEQQAKVHITEPICMYRQEELAKLAESVGFRTIRVWSSAFGNIKGIFGR
jgi:SAM-dependent methyltransferase